MAAPVDGHTGDNHEQNNHGEYQPRISQTEFAESAALHVNDVVHRLTAEHERLVASLQKENQELHAKLTQCHVVDIDAQTQNPLPKSVVDLDNITSSGCNVEDPVKIGSSDTINRVSLDFNTDDADRRRATVREGLKAAIATSGTEDFSTSMPLEGTSGFRYWKRRTIRWVRNGKFDSLVGAVIVANTIVMSLQLEYTGRVFHDEVINSCSACRTRSKAIEAFFEVMEHIFTAIFALELLIRLCVDGCMYLTHISNFLDGIIVIVSMADSWVLGPMGSDVLGSVAVLRLMRLLRLAKILRVVRVMKAFKSLRVLVSAVVNSIGALAWSMTLLFVLELCGAIFMAQVIQPFMEETSDKSLRDYIWKHFGTWTNSMFTIFEITMAPGGFIQYRRLYEEVHPLFGIFSITYVCLVTFAVVRVITAMFLKATLSASDSEDQATACEKTKALASYVDHMDCRLAEDGTKTISKIDVEGLLELPHFSDWLADAGVSRREVLRLFSSLDDGLGEVSFNEFESALRQIRGLPRSADLVLNLNMTRNIMLRVLRMQAMLEQRSQASPIPQKQRFSQLADSEHAENNIDHSRNPQHQDHRSDHHHIAHTVAQN